MKTNHTDSHNSSPRLKKKDLKSKSMDDNKLINDQFPTASNKS